MCAYMNTHADACTYEYEYVSGFSLDAGTAQQDAAQYCTAPYTQAEKVAYSAVHYTIYRRGLVNYCSLLLLI